MGWVPGFLQKKSRLKAIFIDEAGIVSIKKVKYTNNTFSLKSFGEDQAYVIDHNFVTYDSKTKNPVSFYYVNNPNPIRIQHERNKDVDGIGFKKILDSKTISDLFSDEGKNIMTLLLILLAVNIVITLVVALVVFKVIKVAV